METKNRIEKLSKKYGITVLGIDKTNIVYEINGYMHIIKLSGLSQAKLDNPSTMAPSSYLEYLNNTEFLDSPLKAVSIDGNIITVINSNTKEIAFSKKGNTHKTVLLNATTKSLKYKTAIMEALGDKYSYEKCFPQKGSDKVEIVCPIHGSFFVSVNNAIYNHSGCPHCANEYRGYSRTKFKEACIRNNQAGNGTLYLIKIIKNEEEFLKVGITSFADVKNRCKELNRLGCKIEEIKVLSGWAADVYNLEKYIHRNMTSKRYAPSFDFNGRQECYDLSAKEEIEEIIHKRWKNRL